MRLPTFDECEDLAMFMDSKADLARTYAGDCKDAGVRRRHEAEAKRYARVVEILGWMGQRAGASPRDSRLEPLNSPIRTQPRYGGTRA